VIYQPPVENVGDVYGALDCFVLASQFEGFSLALAEAWYCRCPTVATPVGATELTEEHGPLAVSVPIHPTPEQLTAAVRQAIAPANHSVIERAAAVVAQHYTAAAMCRRWTEYLVGLAGR
jgi:glycosyltransferase involved in cell wall biosynthesis